MNVALAPRVTVPAQYLGQARLFRDWVRAEDQLSGETITELDRSIRARFQRGNAVPRRDVLASVARDWDRRMPLRGRLAVSVDLARRGKALTIQEMRLSGSEYRDDAWAEPEKGLAVIVLGLTAAPRRYEFVKAVLCHISMHAIARRVQRGIDSGNEAIKRDLRALGEAHHDLADAENGAAVTVPVPYGSWRCNVATMRRPNGETDRAIAVRTYLGGAGM